VVRIFAGAARLCDNSHIFFGLGMVGTFFGAAESFAVIFLRNQIRPIQRLAEGC